MKNRLLPFLAVSSLFTLGSCSPRLVGTWQVSRYESVTPGQQQTSVNNVGTITFKKNHTGTTDIHYKVLGTSRDITSSFTWTDATSYVTIQAEDAEFAKAWLVVENKKRYQRWQATNGRSQVQTLELKR